jgi:hypothetical protein
MKDTTDNLPFTKSKTLLKAPLIKNTGYINNTIHDIEDFITVTEFEYSKDPNDNSENHMELPPITSSSTFPEGNPVDLELLPPPTISSSIFPAVNPVNPVDL